MKKDWWKKYFNRDYLETHAFIDRYTQEQIKHIIQIIGKPHKKILDVGAGYGRISYPLSQKGYEVIALEYSPEMIRESIKRYKNSSVKFVQGDMRNFDVGRDFDVVLSVFSTFGYFSAAENESHFASMINAMKIGGLLILDIRCCQCSKCSSQKILTLKHVISSEKERFAFMQLYSQEEIINLAGKYNSRVEQIDSGLDLNYKKNTSESHSRCIYLIKKLDPKLIAK